MSEMNQNTIGNLKISEDVQATIAEQAAKEVKGVAKVIINDSNLSGLLKKATKLNPVEIQLNEDSAVVTVSVLLTPEASIPAVSAEIQNQVKASIQNMTGIAVSKVNVVVQGIEFPAQWSICTLNF